MKSTYRAVVIGGGVVGASVLYHLTKFGWSDVALVERAELTAGSTWHAAAGFHALNGDPNIAALQDYTIKLYREIEAESGQDCGLHMTAASISRRTRTGGSSSKRAGRRSKRLVSRRPS
jgi:dimethylglycine dehydrogenase